MQEPTELSYPLEISVFYGSDMDPSIDPEAFVLPSAEALAAFVRGNNEAEGEMDAIFVNHRNYRVSVDGEVREGKAPAKAPSPNERFVVWGDKPDAGTRPVRYVFADEVCAQAFEKAVMARVGWTDSHMVPGQDFRAYRDLEHALGEVPAPVAQCLQAVVKLEEEPLGSFDPIFVNPKGEFVQESWEPGQPVCNRQGQTPPAAPGRRTPNR